MTTLTTLSIYGASDDLVEFRGHTRGELNCYDRTVDVLVGEAPNGAAHIRLAHSGLEGWVVSTLMPKDADEDEWHPPIWTVHNREPGCAPTRHYCPVVEFADLPADCPVRAFVDGEEVAIS